jgi:sulfur-oxidizing protein SoxY
MNRNEDPSGQVRARVGHALTRRSTLVGLAAALPVLSAPSHAATSAADPYDGDPLKTHIWGNIKREFFGAKAKVVFDDHVSVQGPGFAEDPMNVPISFRVRNLRDVERVMVLVDRNPIRKVLEFFPVTALPALAFRFKLEQASAVRVAALGKDGVWHVGNTLVDSSGGGCTVSGGSRKDGSWSSTLGQATGRVYGSSDAPGDAGARLRLKVMHPMDTGLVGGIPAFFVSKLSVRDADNKELARLSTFEPVSENPVFSFDFATPPRGPLTISGTDNNGNRIALKVS